MMAQASQFTDLFAQYFNVNDLNFGELEICISIDETTEELSQMDSNKGCYKSKSPRNCWKASMITRKTRSVLMANPN